MKIKIGIDRKAVLLATGEDHGEFAEIDITKEQMGDDWPKLVAGLDDATPPMYLTDQHIKGLDALAIRASIAGKDAKNNERRVRERGELDRYLAALAEAEAAASQPMTVTPQFAWLSESFKVGQEIGLADVNICSTASAHTIPIAWASRPLPSVNTCWGLLDEFLAEKTALDIRSTALVDRNRQEVHETRLAAIRAIEPQLIAAHAKVAEEKAQAKAEAEAKRQAEITERAANRLATGYWEEETSSYNERRYSSPWCAKVSFPSGAKAIYEFGDSTGKWGKAGLLRVECRPGDIIAHGQKDLRRPGNSDHTMLLMLPNGRMQEVDNTEAFRLWQERAIQPSIADTGAA